MPLQQALPSRWSSQYVFANASTSAITRLDYVISNNGVHFGQTNKTFVGLPFPFVRFYIVNDSLQNLAIKISRVSDGALYWGSVLGANTSTDGSQARSIVIPNDDVNGISLETTGTSLNYSIIGSGLADSGLLPIGPVDVQLPRYVQGSLSQQLQLGGGQAGGQTIGGGLPK